MSTSGFQADCVLEWFGDCILARPASESTSGKPCTQSNLLTNTIPLYSLYYHTIICPKTLLQLNMPLHLLQGVVLKAIFFFV